MHKSLAIGASTNRLPREDAVFVIDDDDAARTGLKQLLGSVGLQVVPFRSAVEFLDCALPDTTCCLVLELCMPGLLEQLS
jgi:two-component system, LuxR family, response regulator FixJ